MYDDFMELKPGAVEECQQMFKHHSRQKLATSGTQDTQNTYTASLSAIANTYNMQSVSRNNFSIGLDDPSLNLVPFPKYEQNTTILGRDPESCWLLLCAKAKERPTCLFQMDVRSTTTDAELFTSLRNIYFGLSGRWKRWLSLSRVRSIRFVQVGDLCKNGAF